MKISKNEKIIFTIISIVFLVLIFFTVSLSIDVYKGEENFTKNRIFADRRYIIHSINKSFLTGKKIKENVFANIKNIAIASTDKNILDSLDLNIYYLTIHNKAGAIIYSNNLDETDSELLQLNIAKILFPLLSGKADEYFYGLDGRIPFKFDHFAYARKINAGKIVVVHMKNKEILELQNDFGIEKILNDLTHSFAPMIHWIALEQDGKIIAGAKVPGNLKKISSEYYKMLNANNFVISKNNEVFFKLIFDGSDYGIIRLKLRIPPKSIMRDKLLNIIIVFVSIFSILLLISYLYVVIKKNKILSEQINQTKRDAATANLASQTAHQFRNPLNGIMLGIQRLQRRINKDGDPEFILDSVFSQAKRLNEMITKVVQLGKPPAINKREIDLSELMLDVCEAEELIAGKNKISFIKIIKSGVLCKADPDRIKEAVGALIQNAIEACVDNDTVTVKLTVEKNSNISIIIEDTGVGIDSEYKEKIFQLYETTKSSGSGLGLVLAQRIAKLHNGNIEFKDNFPRGSIFIFNMKDAKIT